MRMQPQIGLLRDGRRIHLQHGPIDLVIEAFGNEVAVRQAYAQAVRRFVTILDELCDELVLLRTVARPGVCALRGRVARRMHQAVEPFARRCFITPMAAVAGAVAEEVLDAMTEGVDLDRAYVNNGGDIALHLSVDAVFAVGMIDDPAQPGLVGNVTISGRDSIAGIATSGWRGRSFSLGVADAVTVLARTAAEADAAATVIANAVDLPNHPAVLRVPAVSIQPDNDLGDRLVTRSVGQLRQDEISAALAAGAACAEPFLGRGLIRAVALHLQGETRTVGLSDGLRPAAIEVARNAMEYADA